MKPLANLAKMRKITHVDKAAIYKISAWWRCQRMNKQTRLHPGSTSGHPCDDDEYQHNQQKPTSQRARSVRPQKQLETLPRHLNLKTGFIYSIEALIGGSRQIVRRRQVTTHLNSNPKNDTDRKDSYSVRHIVWPRSNPRVTRSILTSTDRTTDHETTVDGRNAVVDDDHVHRPTDDHTVGISNSTPCCLPARSPIAVSLNGEKIN